VPDPQLRDYVLAVDSPVSPELDQHDPPLESADREGWAVEPRPPGDVGSLGADSRLSVRDGGEHGEQNSDDHGPDHTSRLSRAALPSPSSVPRWIANAKKSRWTAGLDGLHAAAGVALHADRLTAGVLGTMAKCFWYVSMEATTI